MSGDGGQLGEIAGVGWHLHERCGVIHRDDACPTPFHATHEHLLPVGPPQCPAKDCSRDIACRPPAPTCPHPFYDRRPQQ